VKYLLTFVVDEARMAEATPEEMKESLGRWSAFDREATDAGALIDCANLDEALEWASKVPMRAGSIEVRAVMDLSPLGYESATVPPAKAAA
jgi:hypothetical protein